MAGIIILIIIVLVAAYLVGIFNKIVRLKNRIPNAWSQVEVQLKKRLDLVPNLVEVVKGYASHEKETLTKVTEARSAIQRAGGDPKAQGEAHNMLTGALKTLFAVAEAYPDLKANQNFLALQEELSAIENKIAYARQFYNDTLYHYNNSIQTFPGIIVARLMGYQENSEYFDFDLSEAAPPKVSF